MIEHNSIVNPAEKSTPARTVEMVTLEIRTLQRQAQQVILGYAIEIGRRLVEVKAMLPHGEWGDYLAREVEYSKSTANNFMRIFQEYGAEQQSLFGPQANSQAIGNLSYTKALRLLALPTEEREEFIAENHVEDMSTRELEEAVKARDEAMRRAEQDRTERDAAEQARKKMADDMTLANQRIAQLRDELEEIRKQPVDVAVEQVDEKTLERTRLEARKAAEQALCAELQSAEEKAKQILREKEALEANLKKAKEQEKQAKNSATSALKQLEDAKKETERIRKELKLAGNKKVAAFGVYFESVQGDFTRMLSVLHELTDGGEIETTQKLTTAVLALLDEMKKQLPSKGAV